MVDPFEDGIGDVQTVLCCDVELYLIDIELSRRRPFDLHESCPSLSFCMLLVQTLSCRLEVPRLTLAAIRLIDTHLHQSPESFDIRRIIFRRIA